MISALRHWQRLIVLAMAVVSLTIASGCAARKDTLVGRFVKPGEPTVSFDLPAAAPRPDSPGEYARRLRTLQANARTNVTLGTTLESSDPALGTLLLNLSMAPTAQNHRRVAAAYRHAGVSDYAYRHLKRALQLEPCDSRAFEGLAHLWREWSAPDLALGDAHRAVHCAPGSASAYNTLGTVLIALGQRQGARRAFEFALRLDSRAAFALNNLCYLALQEGDGEAAQQACERTLALEPTMIAAQTNLALAYAIQGNVTKAEGRLLDRADAAGGLYNVGILRMSMSRYGEAAKAFDLASAARPSLFKAAERAVQARAKAISEREP